MISVKFVEPGTLAERAGFHDGDRIIRVNDTHVKDLIDFQVACAEEQLVFEVERDDETYELEVERGEGESLGFDFEEMRLRGVTTSACSASFIRCLPGCAKACISKMTIIACPSFTVRT